MTSNNNGIKDYNEDFLLFDAEDKDFRDTPDDNNNGLPDDVELPRFLTRPIPRVRKE